MTFFFLRNWLTNVTFWGYHTLLASNGVSYIAGRDGLAKVRWYSGNIIDLTSDDSHPGSLLTGCPQWVA